ncbi:MAG TPA: Gfo/Idh/MocA family oxidoreductase [Burkholderiales bacterium]
MNTSSIARWGIVGVGHVVLDNLAPAISVSPGSRLVACAGRDPVKTRQIGAERTYRNHEELVRDAEVDIVYVATPNPLHKDAVISAARAGKHVLCEKPLALCVAGCRSKTLQAPARNASHRPLLTCARSK